MYWTDTFFSEIDDDHSIFYSRGAETLLSSWLRPRLAFSWLFESEQVMAKK